MTEDSTLADVPPLDNGGPIISSFEFMPAWQFYLPLVPHILGLALRSGGLTTLTAANPAIPGGGLVGESKTQVMDLVRGSPRKLIAPYTKFTRTSAPFPTDNILQQMSREGITFPAVAKPDISCRGVGIAKLKSLDELANYWDAFPMDADFIIQELIDMEPEAGIFYLRHPDWDTPQLFSMTLKYTPSVTGDGTSTLRELISNDARAQLTADVYFQKPNLNRESVPAKGARIKLAFAGNHCRGSVFRDGAEFVTPELTAAIDRVARAMPVFHFGRLDIRFETLAKLQQGIGFRIIEINGVGSEATHIWDNRFELNEARKVLREQYAHAYTIGAKMRNQGNRPIGLWQLIKMWLHERQLTKHYPVSE